MKIEEVLQIYSQIFIEERCGKKSFITKIIYIKYKEFIIQIQVEIKIFCLLSSQYS